MDDQLSDELKLRFDPAIIGLGWQGNQPLLVYDHDRLIDICVREGATKDQAADFVSELLGTTWNSPGAPVVLYRMPIAEVMDFLD